MRPPAALLALVALLALPAGSAGGWNDPDAIVFFRLDIPEGTTAEPLAVDLDRGYVVTSMTYTCMGATGKFAVVGPEGARLEGFCGPLGGWTSATGTFPAGLYAGAASFQAARPIFFEFSGVPAG